jgi:hypothetical protein
MVRRASLINYYRPTVQAYNDNLLRFEAVKDVEVLTTGGQGSHCRYYAGTAALRGMPIYID